MGQLLRIVQGVDGSGLVYVRERKKAEDVAEFSFLTASKPMRITPGWIPARGVPNRQNGKREGYV